MKVSTKSVALVSFLLALCPLVVAPFSLVSGFEYVLESIGIYRDPLTSEFRWGFGGVLYLIGLPIWIGYLWASSSKRTEPQLQRFWMASIVLNAIWVIFFVITLLRPEKLSIPAPVWIAYSLFPTILLPLSLVGLNLAKKHEA